MSGLASPYAIRDLLTGPGRLGSPSLDLVQHRPGVGDGLADATRIRGPGCLRREASRARAMAHLVLRLERGGRLHLVLRLERGGRALQMTARRDASSLGESLRESPDPG